MTKYCDVSCFFVQLRIGRGVKAVPTLADGRARLEMPNQHARTCDLHFLLAAKVLPGSKLQESVEKRKEIKDQNDKITLN